MQVKRSTKTFRQFDMLCFCFISAALLIFLREKECMWKYQESHVREALTSSRQLYFLRNKKGTNL